MIKWYSGSCGGTLVGTGNNFTVTGITATTTYFGRYEDPAPCSYNSLCASVTVTLNQAPVITSCPGTLNANSPADVCEAVVTYSPVISGTPTPTVTHVFTGATRTPTSGPGFPASGTGKWFYIWRGNNSCSYYSNQCLLVNYLFI